MKHTVITPSSLILRYFHLTSSPSLPFASFVWKCHIPPSVTVAVQLKYRFSNMSGVRWTIYTVQNYLVCSHLLRSPNSALICISGYFAQIPQGGSTALVPAWFSRASSRGMPRTVPCSCVAGGCEKPRMSGGDGRGIIHPKPQQEEASLLVSQGLLSSTDSAHCDWRNNYSNAHPNGQWCGERTHCFWAVWACRGENTACFGRLTNFLFMLGKWIRKGDLGGQRTKLSMRIPWFIRIFKSPTLISCSQYLYIFDVVWTWSVEGPL